MASDPRRRRNPVAEVVGAWRAGERAGDDLIRERTKLISGWAKAGILGIIIGTLFLQLAADRKEFRDERRLEREERSARDASLAGALITLDKDIQTLKAAADMEREVCWSICKRRPVRP